jgi:hypothetical protein
MGTLKQRLSQIENKLQILIEGSAARIFPSRKSMSELALKLVEAMHAGLRTDSQGIAWVPNLYSILMHPQEADFYVANPSLINDLIQALDEAGSEAGFAFSGIVSVRVQAEPMLALGEMQVLAEDSQVVLPQTSAIELRMENGFDDPPSSAFLIVDGAQIFSLQKPVINIGRRADNDLVIADNRVSRLHAQVRWVKGRYVVFDLESAGGTAVNDKRVSQAVLRPGDVISLAGVPLVFGLEHQSSDQTQEYIP